MKHLYSSVLSVHATHEIQTASDCDVYRLPLHRLLIALCAVLVFLMLFGCGRKGDPFLSDPIIPVKVRGLTTVARPGAINLQWQAPRKNVNGADLLDLAGFYIYRARELAEDYCAACPRTYELLFDYEYDGPQGQRPKKSRYSYRDTAVRPGSVYAYRVHAYNASEASGQAAGPATVHYDAAPGTPPVFKLERRNKLVVLSWQPVDRLSDGRVADDSIRYRVYRRVQTDDYDRSLNTEPLTEARFEDIPPAYDTVYFYTVRALRQHEETALESDAAAELQLEYFDLTPPETPQFLTAIAQPSGVLLKWKAKTEKGFAGYNIYRRKGRSGEFTRLNPDLLEMNSWLDTTASRRRRYEYAVTAVDDSLRANESALSEPVYLYYIVD